METRDDGDSLRVVDLLLPRCEGEDRLRVRPDAVTQSIEESGYGTTDLAGQEQVPRPEHSG